MRNYRCVVHRTLFGDESEAIVNVTAADARMAANAAIAKLKAAENDWVEVWHEGELVFTRRQSNLHPLRAAIQMARTDFGA